MNKADVLVLDIYKSIRGNWTGGVGLRAETMQKLLTRTTLKREPRMHLDVHLSKMRNAWADNREMFDGREWSRDAAISYDDLTADTDWFDAEYYAEHSLYDGETTDSDTFFARFPAFDTCNYAMNFMLPQLAGRAPNYAACDAHNDAVKLVTMAAVEAFVAECTPADPEAASE